MKRPPRGHRRCPGCGGLSPEGLNTCIHCKASLGDGHLDAMPEFDLAAFRWRVFLLMAALALFAALGFLAGQPLIAALLVLAIFAVAIGAVLVAEHECPDSDRGFFDMVLLLFFGGSE